jgi:cytochrome oxidase Cu insertion factor (SCO1/SenC/PrrC family)
MTSTQQPRSRSKSILALLLVFGPALFLILISTRRCDHRFKELADYGLVKAPSFEVFENGSYQTKNLSDYKGDLVLISTIQTTCPKECGVSLWHFNQILYQHIRKNKRKKLKQVRLISFATDEFGRPASDAQIANIREMLQDDVEGFDPSLWIIAKGDPSKVYDIKHNNQSLYRKGKKYFGGVSYSSLMLLLDKQNHLRMVLKGDEEGMIRRMKEHLALLQKQYDKERAKHG